MRKHARSLIRVLTYQLGTENIHFGIEVGVWQGELSADLLQTYPDLFLVMVDLWQPLDNSTMHDKDNDIQTMQEAMETAEQNTRFARKRRLIVQRASVEEAKQWANETMDFAFLDADHFYESVKADLHAWWPKVRRDGIMAGHDYNGMGDRRKGWGVKRAVDEFFDTIDTSVHVEPGLVWWAKKERSCMNVARERAHIKQQKRGNIPERKLPSSLRSGECHR